MDRPHLVVGRVVFDAKSVNDRLDNLGNKIYFVGYLALLCIVLGITIAQMSISSMERDAREKIEHKKEEKHE